MKHGSKLTSGVLGEFFETDIDFIFSSDGEEDGRSNTGKFNDKTPVIRW